MAIYLSLWASMDGNEWGAYVTMLHLLKTANGAFIPATEADAELSRRFKVGSVVRMDLSEMRNGAYFRKWWALVKVAFEAWSDGLPYQEYHGEQVLPDFERFRKDVTIMAGFCRPVWNAKGELRLEAESLQWSKMTEDRFDQLYSATINVILSKILPQGGMTEASLREWASRVMEFA